ncbi:MAG: right-handed parallel beta-helix repeat-containing protein [Candidatus Hydrogenedentes bacterium]|nr:right-handed parallel beta-helix repeat-containing protein [Candidatus Hydrogenedentota bacterium]
MIAVAPAFAEPPNVLAKVQPGTDGPVQLRNALDAVLANNRDMQNDLVVEIADGVLRLDDTLKLDARHSGSNGHYIVFRAAPGAKPVLSRGTRVENWTADANGRWTAKLNGKHVRQLFVNDVRAQRARGPFPEGAERYGDLKAIDADAGFVVPDAAMAKWKNVAEIEFGFFNSWSHMTCKVAAIAAQDDGRAKVRMQMPEFMLMSRKEGVRAEMPAYIENALELLDEPGEWYADAACDTFHYIPRDGEDIKTANIAVTGDEELLRIAGGAKGRAHHIRFEGIVFAEAASALNDGGHADVQANFAIGADNIYERDGFLVNVHNEYLKPAAAITLEAASDVVFENCTFTRIAGAAVNIEAAMRAEDFAARDVAIRNCAFFDIGGSAIQISDVGRYAHHPLNDEQIGRNIRVEKCMISNIGVEFEDSVGIFGGYIQNCVFADNEIHNLPYSGISIGWGWGEEDAGGSTYPIPFIYESPTPARDNRIANNHIHHVMQKRLDGGGIYTLGNMPGTVIEGNHIHDNPGWPGGIYLDEGSGFIEVRNNKVYNVPTPMNFNNRNQNRIDTCNVQDNDFEEKKQ